MWPIGDADRPAGNIEFGFVFFHAITQMCLRNPQYRRLELGLAGPAGHFAQAKDVTLAIFGQFEGHELEVRRVEREQGVSSGGEGAAFLRDFGGEAGKERIGEHGSARFGIKPSEVILRSIDATGNRVAESERAALFGAVISKPIIVHYVGIDVAVGNRKMGKPFAAVDVG